MMKPRMLAASVLLLAVIAALYLWQQKTIRSLESENSTLRQAAQELETLREENARLAQGRIDPAELERLRAGQLELARLRGQVAQLRREVAEAASKRPAAVVEMLPTEPSVPPVESYLAKANAMVPWKQTLVVGGWKMSSGKRALIFIQPEEGEQVGQIMLQTRIIEMPDSVFTQFGLGGLSADSKVSSLSGLLTIEQADAFIKALEQMDGASVKSPPKVLTSDGKQAHVKVLDFRPMPSGGGKYEVGPYVEFVPKISQDHKSVDLAVSAELRSLPIPRE